MAILRTRARAAAIAHAAAVALMLGLAGCALIDRLRGEPRFAFSHALHVGEEELDCTNCHESYAVSDDPGMPAPDTCSACHDEIDPEKPPERQVACLFDDAGAFRATRASRLPGETIFSHHRHVEAGLECSECHDGIESNRAIDADVAVPMKECSACHRDRALPNDCATCHREIDADWAPPSHSAHWIREHGRVVREQSDLSSDDCASCHSEATCIACHRESAPLSHDAFFRRRGHGLFAALDRQSCAACHTADTCASCHQETRPLSHTGAFGGVRNNHCLGCHFPLKAEGCATCHPATPSHALGTPKPAWHNAAMNCRQCHGISAPLPHVEKGDDCNACHP